MPATCTPEGQPIKCCVCQHTVIVEPSRLASDVCCPCCGSLNWMAEISPLEQFLLQRWLHAAQRRWLRRFLKGLVQKVIGGN